MDLGPTTTDVQNFLDRGERRAFLSSAMKWALHDNYVRFPSHRSVQFPDDSVQSSAPSDPVWYERDRLREQLSGQSSRQMAVFTYPEMVIPLSPEQPINAVFFELIDCSSPEVGFLRVRTPIKTAKTRRNPFTFGKPQGPSTSELVAWQTPEPGSLAHWTFPMFVEWVEAQIQSLAALRSGKELAQMSGYAFVDGARSSVERHDRADDVRWRDAQWPPGREAAASGLAAAVAGHGRAPALTAVWWAPAPGQFEAELVSATGERQLARWGVVRESLASQFGLGKATTGGNRLTRA